MRTKEEAGGRRRFAITRDAMLTVLIHGADDAPAFAQTLSPLVSGAVEGILRDVVVLDAVGDDVRRVADHAGCRLASAGEVLAAPAALKGEWVLILRSGERLPENWIDRVVRYAGGRSAVAAARLPEPEPGIFDRLFGRSRGGVLASRAALVAAAPASGERIDRLVRALKPRRMRRGG